MLGINQVYGASIRLSSCCAMPSTHAAMCLGSCYAMSGTDAAYPSTRSILSAVRRGRSVLSSSVFPVPAYARPMPCPVLT
eukprot:3600176-Rhodomonas_salina.1